MRADSELWTGRFTPEGCLRRAIEKGYNIGPDSCDSLFFFEDGTFGVHKSLGIDGVVDEGGLMAFANSKNAAVIKFKYSFWRFAFGKGDWIYWRDYPRFIEHEGRWGICARLFVTDHAPDERIAA